MIRIEPSDAVQPSTYNPRKADEARLKMVETSLRKLGFLLPIYADADGEIISGHQRHYVATERMGATVLPIVRLPAMPLDKRKVVNILFNRGTNDFERQDTPATIRGEAGDAIDRLASEIPDKAIDSDAFLPCVHRCRTVSVDRLVKVNTGWIPHAKCTAAALLKHGVVMPIVARADGKVVNGIGRLEAAANAKITTYPVVLIDDAESELARALLNRLSMDFDLHNRYADLLRYNSFRRPKMHRDGLGRGKLVVVAPREAAKRWKFEGANLAAWKRAHGLSVVDFGAGKMDDARILRSGGIHVAAFEPFVIAGDLTATDQRPEIDEDRSRVVVREFLADIATGRRYTSVFCSTVINSIPFAEDRRHVVTLLAALTGSGRCYVYTKSILHPDFSRIEDRTDARNAFRLDYEPGVILSEYFAINENRPAFASMKPKVQKFFSTDELYELVKHGFDRVAVSQCFGDCIGAIAEGPMVDPDRLRAAIEFEFDLMYPSGRRMGLVEEAKNAFSARLGLHL